MKTRLPQLVLAIVFVLITTGCQTFTLTPEEWERQQNGGTADRETGAVVDVVGSAAYWGAAIGAVAAGVK